MKWLCLLLLTCSAMAADYQRATLVSISDRTSNRTIGSAGQVTTVTDVEYRITVAVNGMAITGSYWPRWKWSYAPTDFVVNDEVEIKLEGEYMLVKRPNGKSLKTRIVRRERYASAQIPSTQ